MNLFSARLSGKMLSTEQFEQKMAEMANKIVRYREVEKSPELAEYLSLKTIVESAEFQQKKREWQGRKYSNTEPGIKTARYEQLSGSMRMRGYQRALEMPTFVSFLKFRESENFSKMKDPKERRHSSELRMYNIIDRSAFYQNYLKVLHSPELKEMKALEAEFETEEFKKQDAFWRNKNRWFETEEYRQESRFNELAKSDDIRFFLSQKAEDIEQADIFRPTFADNMTTTTNWKPGNGYQNKNLKNEYSLTSEHQAYNHGKNTIFAEGRMDIETRKETTTALAWDTKRGFVEHVFSYTSDMMNTKDVFAQEGGLFMAKVRTQGSGHHFLGLSSGKPSDPMVAIYCFNGKEHCVGVFDGKNTRQQKLTGSLRSIYHIYALRWTKKELIWYVNNLEVMRMPNNLPQEQFFLLAKSFLPATEAAGEGKLKVQWVKVFSSAE